MTNCNVFRVALVTLDAIHVQWCYTRMCINKWHILHCTSFCYFCIVEITFIVKKEIPFKYSQKENYCTGTHKAQIFTHNTHGKRDLYFVIKIFNHRMAR